MAVQAQYPSNALLFSRTEQEMKDMDYSQPPPPPPPQPLFFNNGAVYENQRKRPRDPSASSFQMVQSSQINLLSPSTQSPALINLALLQTQTPLVSTGLKLFEDNPQSQSQSQSQDLHLASLINNQTQQLEQYIIAQGEQLRRTLADRKQAHYRALLATAEETAARRLREKDLELNRAVQKTADLEDRIGRLRTESLTWQAKAMWGQATAASLHAQIQQVSVVADKTAAEFVVGGSSAAEDAESAYVDPYRAEASSGIRTCRVCRVAAVSVVLLPCLHLCLCSACDAAVNEADAVCCPVCHAGRSGSVQVFLS